MPEFSFKAKNRNGHVINGRLHASSREELKAKLAQRGLRPIVLRLHSVKQKDGKSVKADQSSFLDNFLVKDEKGNVAIQIGSDLPSQKELAVFTKQFSLMISNGVDMIRCLTMLEQQQKRKGFKRVIGQVIALVQNGASLSDSLETFPKVFDNLYIALVRAGEASGKLDRILKQLVIYIEKSAKIKSQVRSALMYPIMVLVVAIGVISILLAFVVPQMTKQFEDSGQKLPELTQIVVDASKFFRNEFHLIFGALFAAFVLLKLWANTPGGRQIIDTMLLKAPVIGDVMTKISIGRFCSTMATMLASGVQILQSLDICAASSGNLVIEKFIIRVRDEISKGRSFSEPLSETPLIPMMVTSMVTVGEASGTLDETLAKVTEIYEEEVDRAIETMTSMIEPIMLVVLGGIVGFLLIAMYLPIFDMAGTVG